MAVVTLQLQSINADGSTNTTVDLSVTGAAEVLAYTPLHPNTTDAAFDPGPLGDGGELLASGYRNVTEPSRVLIIGANVGAVRTKVRAIELMFEQALRYSKKKVFPRVYVLFVPESGGTVLRSELLSGQLAMQPVSMERWSTCQVEVAISWTRRFFWEANADVQMALTNSHSANNTTGIQIDTVQDAGTGRNNFVTPATAPLGTLPAPVRLEITNSTNDANNVNSIHVGATGYGDGTAYTAFDIEGETATGGSALPGSPNTSLYSGGQYRTVTYNTDSIEHQLFEWTLSTTLLNATRGQFYRLVVRFAQYPTGFEYIRFRVWFAGLTIMWEGPLIKLQNGVALADLGAVQLPPWLVGVNSLSPLTLRMYGTSYDIAGGATQTVAVDVIHLLPTYNWRKYTARGYGLPYTYRLVDDQVNGYIYQDSGAGTARTGYYGALGSPLVLDPGMSQSFFFAWDTQTGSSDITRTMTVKMWYRPRYLSI